MKIRIEEIIKKYNMSSSQFADKIGVPRSGLSHVIKGRNKPSLDYVLRILKSFPEIDSNWLLTGEGALQNEFSRTRINVDNTLQEKDLSQIKDLEREKLENTAAIDENNEDRNSSYVDSLEAEEDTSGSHSNLEKKYMEKQSKKVDKIVFFYSDGSFKEYLN